MKTIAFICLLSLSMSFSQPAGSVAGTPENQTPPAAPHTEQAAQTTPAKTDGKKPTAVPADKNVPQKEEPIIITTQPPVTEKAAPVPSPATPVHNNETKPVDNKTTDTKPSEKTTEPPKTDKKAETTITPAADAKTDAKPEKDAKTDAKPATPTEAAPVKTTEAPKDATENPPTVQARGFDGPSFIGGIILTLGLLAIGFMGFKYYKNQTERNYHTL